MVASPATSSAVTRRAVSPAPPFAAPAYRVKKYQVLHSGSSTWRTFSRMPSSVTTRFPPRRIGEAIRNHRIASEPSRSNTSATSG